MLRETWVWQMTRDDDVIARIDCVWEAALPRASLRLEWWPHPTMRLTVRAEPATMERVQAAVWAHVEQSPDEVDVLAVLGRSAAFTLNLYGSGHRRLRDLRYSPMRLDWKRVDDDVGTLAALDRIAAQRPSVAAQAVLAAALLEALGGRVEPALARVEAASVSSLDLRLLRADLLSRLGRDEEALAALPEVAAADPQAHAAAALRVAILHRAGRLGEAASEALALADLASTPALWGVPSAFARAIAVLLAEDAGDAALLELARERLGADATHVADLAGRGISRPAQWFLLAHASPDRLGTLGAPQARTGR